MTNDESARAQLGIHDWLRITAVPAGAKMADGTTMIGRRLIDAGALPVAGNYECEFRVDGLQKLDVRLKATFGAGSSTTTGGSEYADRVNFVQNWTGIGAMTTGVEQALTIAALKGEKYAKVVFAIVGVAVNFSVAEVMGLRV